MALWAFVVVTLTMLTAQAEFTIDTEFPGGNVTVEGIEGDTIRLAPDNRDSTVPWFYWNFAVRGAAGKTLQFVLSPRVIGVHGPGISTDGGKSWKWLGADAVKEGVFSYTFPAGANDVRFSVGMPYVTADFLRFMEKYKGNPNVQMGVLTKSPKDREVPLIKIGAPGRKAPYAIAVTGRHHASEMMGSYVIEGIIQGALADDAQGKWLRDNVDFFIVPFVDYDGVEDGDQGKNRAPHDHNRDYAETPIYPEVAAIKEQVPAWSAGRPLIFIDVHDPALKGDIHEVIQFLAPQEGKQAEQLDRLAALVEMNNQGPIIFRSSMIMKFGVAYNGIVAVPPPISSGWARTLPNTLFGVSLEMPYANTGGCEVNSTSAREFGHDIAWGLKAYLKEVSETKSN